MESNGVKSDNEDSKGGVTNKEDDEGDVERKEDDRGNSKSTDSKATSKQNQKKDQKGSEKSSQDKNKTKQGGTGDKQKKESSDGKKGNKSKANETKKSEEKKKDAEDESNSKKKSENKKPTSKPCKNEIQERIRIYELKKLHTQELQKSRKRHLHNLYKGFTSEKTMVRGLTTGYNENRCSRTKHKRDEFDSVEDWDNWLMGEYIWIMIPGGWQCGYHDTGLVYQTVQIVD